MDEFKPVPKYSKGCPDILLSKDDFDLKCVYFNIPTMVNQQIEEVVIAVLKQLLKREPTIDDARHTSLLYRDADLVGIAYKGTTLGSMKCEWHESHKFTVTFIPL
jgi:hypothetical protein